MKNKHLIFIFASILFISCISQKERDLNRMYKLNQIYNLYDSIIKHGEWISLSQFNKKPTQITFMKKDSTIVVTEADSINDPKLIQIISLNRNDIHAITRLFKMMYTYNPNYFSVGCSGNVNKNKHTIILSYNWNKFTTRNYFYEYINDDGGIQKALKNKHLRHIRDNVFKGSGIER